MTHGGFGFGPGLCAVEPFRKSRGATGDRMAMRFRQGIVICPSGSGAATDHAIAIGPRGARFSQGHDAVLMRQSAAFGAACNPLRWKCRQAPLSRKRGPDCAHGQRLSNCEADRALPMRRAGILRQHAGCPGPSRGRWSGLCRAMTPPCARLWPRFITRHGGGRAQKRRQSLGRAGPLARASAALMRETLLLLAGLSQCNGVRRRRVGLYPTLLWCQIRWGKNPTLLWCQVRWGKNPTLRGQLIIGSRASSDFFASP